MEPIQSHNPQRANVRPPQPRPMLSFGQAVSICWKKYFDFTGRARRSEYWWWVLFHGLVNCAGRFLDGMFSSLISFDIGSFIVWLILVVPTYAVTTRRLHDTGRSGWWLVAFTVLAGLIVFVALSSKCSPIECSCLTWPDFIMNMLTVLILALNVITLFFTLLDSHYEENKYGRSPKYQ